MRKKVRLLLNDVGAHSEEVVVELLHGLAKKQGMLFAKRSDLQLSVAQSMAIRDHVGTGTKCLTRALSEVSDEVKSQLKEGDRVLAIEEEVAKDANRLQSAGTEIGEYNLILGGLNEFVEILKTRKGLDGKRPQSDLEYAFWRSVESRAGGS